MDYDRRRTRWPWVFLFLMYTGVVVYLLMTNNKYLYANRELRVALAGERIESVSPVPRLDSTRPDDLGAATYWSRGSPERTSHDLSGTTREREFVPEWTKMVMESEDPHAIKAWAVDDSGVYLTGSSPWAVALTSDGDPKWRFRFASHGTERGLLEPITDLKQIYLAQPAGQIIALNKQTGALVWKLSVADEILTAPLIIEKELWLVVKPLDSEVQRLDDLAANATSGKPAPRKGPAVTQVHRLVRLNRQTGELLGYSETFPVKGPTFISWAREQNQILLASDNKLIVLSSEDGKIISTQTLPDAIKGPAVVAEGKVFLALTSGKIQAWDLTKKGKFEWEVDVDGPPQTSPTYIPLYQRLAVLTGDGHFHMVDIKKAEHMWHFSLENRNPSQEIWSARLSGKHIERLNMKWEKRGWTAWAPCSDNRVCVYNPEKGQLVARISSPGAVLSPPLFVGKNFFIISVERDGDKRRFRLSHYMDDESFKKKTKSASDSAASNEKTTEPSKPPI